MQLIVAGYAFAFGLTLVPAGRLGDIHSRKIMFPIGLSLFTLASVLCAIAPDITFLLIARTLQGVAAGIQMPQVLGLLQQLFQGKERGRVFGVFGATIGLSTALGPALGGLLIAIGGEEDGWRLLFWMNALSLSGGGGLDHHLSRRVPQRCSRLHCAHRRRAARPAQAAARRGLRFEWWRSFSR